MNLSYLKSSVGKKTIMALTGASLILFLISHLFGNLLVFSRTDSLNIYAHQLSSSPLIYVAEFLLVIIFITHITTGFMLTLENLQARPVPYIKKTSTSEGATWSSSTMPYTGALIFLGLIIHLVNFKFGIYYADSVDGIGRIRDLERLLTDFFASGVNTFSYIFAIFVLSIHLSHGFWSLFQTLGLSNEKAQDYLRKLALIFSTLIFASFSAIPFLTYLANKNN